MKRVLYPTLLAVTAILGIKLGETLTEYKMQAAPTAECRNGKLDYLFNLIKEQYVEDVDVKELEEKAIPEIMAGLDPHSVYIPAANLQSVNEALDGSFSGIGVEFNIQNDTVMILAVINGGPSEKVGLLPGDRIVEVNDSLFVGKDISNEKVMKKLRGPKGTMVKVGVKRNNSPEILHFDIVRGDIPLTSVDVAYMIDPETGYVKVNKFGSTTFTEFSDAMYKLKADGASKFVIDLRGNPGGYMNAAIKMINMFLKKNDMIVYTEGKTLNCCSQELADGTGEFQDVPVVVLIDEWSASASEIFAGAIQDNDRGFVIGRRSFGKGLVQQQFTLRDSSAIRLTISRFHTPSGRCIQKPYAEDYEDDIYKRYLHGEFYAEDSVFIDKADSLTFKTANGRTVYGGGGIMPDMFVPRDTSEVTPYFNKVNNSGLIHEFAFAYTDANRNTLKQFKTTEELESYLDKQDLCSKFTNFAEGKNVKKKSNQIAKSKSYIENLLKAYIARNTLGYSGFYPILHKKDNTLKKALDALHNNWQLLENNSVTDTLQNNFEDTAKVKQDNLEI
ncbi:MAG: S41 family peptidase [Paludibacteraceae bacterium]|nr:S41 family peptidase [Paludibacteraceae bacterium]